jgi:hypothetical protein
MSAPVIHGKGRIMFTAFEPTALSLDAVRAIPGGPAVNTDFIREGRQLLLDRPGLVFPPLLVVRDFDEGGTFTGIYWIIDGRHRYYSYGTANITLVPGMIGHGMTILD